MEDRKIKVDIEDKQGRKTTHRTTSFQAAPEALLNVQYPIAAGFVVISDHVQIKQNRMHGTYGQ